MKLFVKSHELINEDIIFIDRIKENCLSKVMLDASKEYNLLSIDVLIVDTTKKIPNEYLSNNDFKDIYYSLKERSLSLIKITVYAKK